MSNLHSNESTML